MTKKTAASQARAELVPKRSSYLALDRLGIVM